MAATSALDQVWYPLPRRGPRPAETWQRRRPRRNWRPWVIGGVAAAAVLFFLLFQFTPLFRSGTIVPSEPTTISRVVLENDPQGIALSLVLADALGRDTSMTGELTLDLREAGGAVWHSVASLTPGDFRPLPADSVLSGRLGYRVVVQPSAFPIPPRRGNQATVTVTVAPRDRTSFTAVFREFVP